MAKSRGGEVGESTERGDRDRWRRWWALAGEPPVAHGEPAKKERGREKGEKIL